MRPMNSNKNKLYSEIILIFNPNPNAHLVFLCGDNFGFFNLNDVGP